LDILDKVFLHHNSGDMVIDAGATMTADAMQDAAFTAGDAADQFGYCLEP
jgi:hypothetical protein